MTDFQDDSTQDIPTLKSVLQDSVHGSAWISLRALDVLRHRASELAAESASTNETRREIDDLAEKLAVARPPMVSVGNRVHRFMERAAEIEAGPPGSLAGSLVSLADELRVEAVDKERLAAANAADLVSGKNVFTLSRSATVMTALQDADPPPSVVVAESLPGGEGRGVARDLSDAGLEVTLVPDAVMAIVLSPDWEPPIDLVLFGADTVTAAGDVVNKSGTRLAALAAQATGVPCYAVLTTDKISRDPEAALDKPTKSATAPGSRPRTVEPVFELTPRELMTGLVTEEGIDDGSE